MEKIIKSKERVKKFGEVMTPSWVVNKMLDQFPPEVWENLDFTFLEPACGNGNFCVEILNRKYGHCKDYRDGLKALASLTAIDIQADNVAETKERLLSQYYGYFGQFGIDEAASILNEHIICADALKLMQKWIDEEK